MTRGVKQDTHILLRLVLGQLSPEGHGAVSAARSVTSKSRCIITRRASLGAYARLRFLPDPVYAGQAESEIDGDAPSEPEPLCATQVLRRHTRAPDDCYFCLWDGWGLDIDGDDGTRDLDLGGGDQAHGSRRRSRPRW